MQKYLLNHKNWSISISKNLFEDLCNQNIVLYVFLNDLKLKSFNFNYHIQFNG